MGKPNKFNDEVKEKLVRFRAEGLGSKRIAKELGVSNSTVSLWLNKCGIGGTLDEYKMPGESQLTYITCQTCGKKYASRYSTTKFCGDACRSKFNKKHRGHKRTCIECKKTFKDYKERKLCSDKCKEVNQEKKRLKRLEKSEAKKKDKQIVKLRNVLLNITARNRTCCECGKDYILKKHDTGFKYCSDECKEEGYRKIRRSSNRKVKKPTKDKRWRKNGKVDYSVTLEKLHKRDGGVCYMCNRKTDYDDFVITEF